ncbi:hypothetical protein [Nocardia grenadensis]|uniref:hypothetical protein n=1 Tax=Nocardia grenadensis TaxID=931537 RepID=UPI0007A4FFB5|nr:hypothetical protein [Nocardia grenadensis]
MSPDSPDLGIYADHEDLLSEWGTWTRTSEATDFGVIAATVAAVIQGIEETPGIEVSHIQLGNIIAHILHNHGAFHRRPNC